MVHITHVRDKSQTKNTKSNQHDRPNSSAHRLHFFTVFKVVFSLLIALLTSLEGLVIETKPTTLDLDTAVS